MFFFGRKKEKVNQCVLSVSGEQLFCLLKSAVSLAIEDVESNCYITGPEIMFEYDGNIHFLGIKYDKKRAKTEKRRIFSYDLMTIYIDKVLYVSMEDFGKNASIDRENLLSISSGIIISSEYSEWL